MPIAANSAHTECLRTVPMLLKMSKSRCTTPVSMEAQGKAAEVRVPGYASLPH
jgi:hypothetical protein